MITSCEAWALSLSRCLPATLTSFNIGCIKRLQMSNNLPKSRNKQTDGQTNKQTNKQTNNQESLTVNTILSALFGCSLALHGMIIPHQQKHTSRTSCARLTEICDQPVSSKILHNCLPRFAGSFASANQTKNTKMALQRTVSAPSEAIFGRM